MVTKGGEKTVNENKKNPHDVRDQGDKKSFSEWVEDNYIIFLSIPTMIALVLLCLSCIMLILKL